VSLTELSCQFTCSVSLEHHDPLWFLAFNTSKVHINEEQRDSLRVFLIINLGSWLLLIVLTIIHIVVIAKLT
jgi:hypothetical protein